MNVILDNAVCMLHAPDVQ